MSAFGTGGKAWLLGSALTVGCSIVGSHGQAAEVVKHHTPEHHVAVHHVAVHQARAHQVSTARVVATNHVRPHAGHIGYTTHSTIVHASYLRMRQAHMHFHGISCVPYARELTGMQIAGNAWQWWGNAAGVYARGDRPEAGAVLNFRANGRMRLGHVAVVSRVVNQREVVIDHANWPTSGGYGGVAHDVAVVDVSEANDWSAVRVELGRGGTFGSVYPTYGFIYNRPDTGMVTASVSRPAPQPLLNTAPTDLRPRAERPWRTMEEVAEAPADGTARHIDLRIVPASANGR